jgi:hypothetical protein
MIKRTLRTLAVGGLLAMGGPSTTSTAGERAFLHECPALLLCWLVQVADDFRLDYACQNGTSRFRVYSVMLRGESLGQCLGF